MSFLQVDKWVMDKSYGIKNILQLEIHYKEWLKIQINSHKVTHFPGNCLTIKTLKLLETKKMLIIFNQCKVIMKEGKVIFHSKSHYKLELNINKIL
jgi:hypothetical protein